MAICAFCARDERLTKEHVWPNWLIKFMPDPYPDRKRVRPMGRYDERGKRVWKQRMEGDYHSATQVRVVCGEHCNGGWMRNLEKEIGPILKPIAKDEPTHLSAHDLQVVAFWTAKTMMMMEYVDDEARATSAAQRRYLYEHREERRPLPLMKVWLGHLTPDGPLARGYWHNPMRLVMIVPPPGQTASPEVSGPGPANCSHTTFAVGHVVLTVMNSIAAEFFPASQIDEARFGLHQIWPSPRLMDWPPNESKDMDIRSVQQLAYLFEQPKGTDLARRED